MNAILLNKMASTHQLNMLGTDFQNKDHDASNSATAICQGAMYASKNGQSSEGSLLVL